MNQKHLDGCSALPSSFHRFGQPPHRPGKREGNCPGGLALNQCDRPTAARHEKVHFQPLFVAEVIKLAPPPHIHLRFDDLRRDKAFKEGAGERRLGLLGRRVDAQQMTRETRVGEIDLGRVDQAFAEVFVERRRDKNLRRRLQHSIVGFSGGFATPSALLSTPVLSRPQKV
jgi:hypothetical protein